MKEQITSLLDKLGYLSSKEKKEIEEAIDFATAAHEGQKRASGDEYITHPIEVAKILADFNMPPVVIIAGLLHDVVEDTPITREIVEKKFGKTVAFFVDGVSKLGAVRYKGFKQYINDTQKLFVSASKDLRVIAIKLADRLHNMRTLYHLPEVKQEKIAQETNTIYAPIAYQLGMENLAVELRELSFKYLEPEIYKNLKVDVEKFIQQDLIDNAIKGIRKELVKHGFSKFTSFGRQKSIYSIHEKMKDKKYILDQIEDIVAIRILVKTIPDTYRVLGIVHSAWKPIPKKFKDYIAYPKPNGYQSLHTRIQYESNIIEIQIRTYEIEEISKYGLFAHMTYKDNAETPSKALGWLMKLLPHTEKPVAKQSYTWLDTLASMKSSEVPEAFFMEDLETDFLKERMFIFTPKGDVIDLPKGSTMLDFAFAIHEDIGVYAEGGHVNNIFCPLSKTLHNNDVVNIKKGKASKTHAKLLNTVKTSYARAQIRKHTIKSNN